MATQASASSKILEITEILENIFSFLSGPDLVTVSKADKAFHKCIVGSPVLQTTLCLRLNKKVPPQCYQVHRMRTMRTGYFMKARTLGLTPFAGVQHDDEHHFAEPCLAVFLCPGLKLDNSHRRRKNRAQTVAKYGVDYEGYSDDVARFTMQPSELEQQFGPTMFLSDPPLRDVDVYLFYQHANSSFAVSVRARVTQDSPLTLRSLLDTASLAKGRVYLEGEYAMVPRHWCKEHMLHSCRLHREICIEHLDDVSLKEVTTRHVKKHGGGFLLDLEKSWVNLRAVCPTDEEWKTMRDILAEEKNREMSMDPEEYAAWRLRLLRRAPSETPDWMKLCAYTLER